MGAEFFDWICPDFWLPCLSLGMFTLNIFGTSVRAFGLVLLTPLIVASINAQLTHQPAPEPIVWSVDAREGNNPGFFGMIVREGSRLRYQTIDGTAKAGVDYIALSGMATNSDLIQVIIPDDGKIEPPKTLELIVIEEGPDVSRTNRVEMTIYDNETAQSRDFTFRTDFRPMVPGYPLGDVQKLVSGRVLTNGTLMIVEQTGFTTVDERGVVQSRHLFPEWTRSNLWLSAVTPEGNVILGRPSTRGGSMEEPLVRFLANGQHDQSFHAELMTARVHGLAVSPQGKILVGFTHTNLAEWSVVQLNQDGSIDSSFAPLTREWNQQPGFSFPYLHQHIGVSLDGSIQIVTPDVYTQEMILKDGVVVAERLLYDGSLRPKAADRWLGEGVVMAANDFPSSLYFSTSLYRLNADGSLDESFATETLPTQFAYLGTQRDGKVLALSDGELIRINNTPEETNRVGVINLNGGEEDEEAYILLRRTGDTSAARTVRLQTVDSTAKGGLDYVHLDTLVTFEPLQSDATARFRMIDDDLSEGTESLVVRLSSPDNDALIEIPDATVFLWDREAYMELIIESLKDGTIRIGKDYQPEWSAMLQSSTNLGKTWTDLSVSSNNLWMISPSLTAGSQIFRAVKVGEPAPAGTR